MKTNEPFRPVPRDEGENFGSDDGQRPAVVLKSFRGLSLPSASELVLDSGLNPDLGPNSPVISGGKTFNLDAFEAGIRSRLDGKCAGYGFAINMNGQLARFGGNGFRQIHEDAGDNLPFRHRKRMHVASISKNLTAVGVLKALDDFGLDINEPIAAYLPSQWNIHPSLQFLTFRHLLRHRSGFYTTDANGNYQGASTRYNDLRQAMENRVNWNANLVNDSQRWYDNRNFGLFRLILPYLVATPFMNNAEVTGNLLGDYHPRVDSTSRDFYKVCMRHYVFHPLGMNNMDCEPDQSDSNRVFCYDWPNPEPEQANDGGDWSDRAGGAGWVMSPKQLAKFMAYRRYSNSFLSSSLRAEMDTQELGWLATLGDNGRYLQHGGAFNSSGPLRTCIMQFPIQVEAVVMVNSYIVNPNRSLSPRIRNAYDEAWQ